ncbi:MAG: hypothetical protein LUC85_09125 [Bacteroidales bacterium]|nr:hypothetical protein [Bacteroidales bacterium]
MPRRERKCLESWHRILPGYKIMAWTEATFPFSKFPFAKEAYDARKWAFVADLARIKVLFEYGGIYLDTDVEVIRPMDELLANKSFMGMECHNRLGTGIIGAEKNSPFIGEIQEMYKNLRFSPLDNIEANSKIITDLLLHKENLSQLEDKAYDFGYLRIYPSEFFCPIDQASRVVTPTDNSFTVHYLSSSWLPWRLRLRQKAKELLGVVMGRKRFYRLYKSIIG